MLEKPVTLKTGAGKINEHIMRGHAFLAKGQVAEASEELAPAEKTLSQATGYNGAGQMRASAAPYLDGLRGEVLLHSDRRDEARAILKEVERKVRAVPGPDAWSQALFRPEAIARAARQAGDWELAAYTAEQMKHHDPAYAGTHYALALVAEHKGDTALAKDHFTKARQYWGRADTDLWEMAELRKK